MLTPDDLRRAQKNIQGIAHRTPLLRSQSLDERVGFPVFLKAENFQKIGAFKIRGASNWLARAKESGRKMPGVITYSSGNHGQAVAYAAKVHGLPAIIVAPENAPKVKVEAMRGYGARVEFCGTTSDERKKRAEEIAAGNNYAMIPPFDDPWIIAGQGTAALEILEEQPGIASLIAPVGGGGLIAGSTFAAKTTSPKIQVFGVEAELADKMARSMDAKKIVSIKPGNTIADGLKPSAPGVLNFEICQKYLDRVVRVSEADIQQAVLFLLTRLKIVVEPSGAAGVAAILSGKLKPPSPCAIILSGGNIEPAVLAKILQ